MRYRVLDARSSVMGSMREARSGGSVRRSMLVTWAGPRPPRKNRGVFLGQIFTFGVFWGYVLVLCWYGVFSIVSDVSTVDFDVYELMMITM